MNQTKQQNNQGARPATATLMDMMPRDGGRELVRRTLMTPGGIKLPLDSRRCIRREKKIGGMLFAGVSCSWGRLFVWLFLL